MALRAGDGDAAEPAWCSHLARGLYFDDAILGRGPVTAEVWFASADPSAMASLENGGEAEVRRFAYALADSDGAKLLDFFPVK